MAAKLCDSVNVNFCMSDWIESAGACFQNLPGGLLLLLTPGFSLVVD
jgi:hypothetical protein